MRGMRAKKKKLKGFVVHMDGNRLSETNASKEKENDLVLLIRGTEESGIFEFENKKKERKNQ